MQLIVDVVPDRDQIAGTHEPLYLTRGSEVREIVLYSDSILSIE